MSGYPVETAALSEHEMIRHAVVRSVVRLDDGSLAQLVSWNVRNDRSRARVEFPVGRRRRTVRKSSVVTVEEPGRSFVRKVDDSDESR